MKIINLFGAAGVGKSLTMHGLTYEMKKMGLRVENTPEVVKEMIFEESNVSRHGGQLYLLAEQNRRIARLESKADYIITDCPLMLIAYYTPVNYIEGFEKLAIKLANSYENVNFLLTRNKKFEFENENRFHDESQSDEKAEEIKSYLDNNKVHYLKKESDDFLVGELIDSMLDWNIIEKEHIEKARNPDVRKRKMGR